MTKVQGLSAAFDGVGFRAWIQVRAAVAFGVLALIAIPAHQVQAGCASVITACGCTITDAALHTIANNIFASDGLTGKGDCIDIKHKGATLDGGFFEVDGDGATGVGIRILPGATKVAVQNFDGIFGWDIGIEDGRQWRHYHRFRHRRQRHCRSRSEFGGEDCIFRFRFERQYRRGLVAEEFQRQPDRRLRYVW